MVQGDLNDIDSLNLAFQGANVIFGVTDFWQPFLEQANYAKLKAGQTINDHSRSDAPLKRTLRRFG